MFPVKRKRRRTSATALAGVIFVAAAAMTLSVLVLHGSHRFPTAQKDLAKDYLPAFVKSGGGLPVVQHRAHQTTSSNMTRDSNATTCFSLNSNSWVKGERLGNAPLETDEAATDLILDMNFPLLLEQTICHTKSRFLDWPDTSSSSSNDDISFNLAALRLVYLAFYVHQHEPAWKEARHRQKYCTRNDLHQFNIGNLDYECPEAKFLVVPLGEAGLGAIMRLTVVNALLAGMATGRVVMFVNNATVGPRNVQQPWPHASCPRHDLQCFFLTPTPCVLTRRELEKAHVLERSEMRLMFRNGQIPGAHANDRVVVTKINTRPHMVPPNLREHLVAIVRNHVIANQDNNLALLERAAELIYEIEALEDSQYYYFGRRSKVHHGAVFYAMRPRPEYAKLLNTVVTESLPDNFHSEVTLGLPIRGT